MSSAVRASRGVSEADAEAVNGDAVEVAVIVVAYRSDDDLPVCLEALAGDEDARVVRRVVVVHNDAPPAGGEDRVVGDEWVDDAGVVHVWPGENLGFTGGNNLGWRVARGRWPGCGYVALLNPDTRARAGWLGALVAGCEGAGATAAQAVLWVMGSDPTVLNSRGNAAHWLGFGWVEGFGEPAEEGSAAGGVREVAFASGAACVVRADWVAAHGLFDDVMFLYGEDVELGWRVWLSGGRVVAVDDAVVEHRYDPGGVWRHFARLENNRWQTLLTVYRRRTVVLLMPAAVAVEALVLVGAAMRGVGGAKLRSYASVWSRSWWSHARARRRALQATRRVRDRELLRRWSLTLGGPGMEAGVSGVALRWVVNPLLAVYGTVLRGVVWW